MKDLIIFRGGCFTFGSGYVYLSTPRIGSSNSTKSTIYLPGSLFLLPTIFLPRMHWRMKLCDVMSQRIPGRRNGVCGYTDLLFYVASTP